ncbi:hypothetical protein [Streptomyces odonnellii]|uniref:hypothetical protein n=1 Tax=Streptomyces odonnellii TaxID=1417980 RepID=UPI000625CA09|nr:hypothetical protein [Streptomyces odonnellii]
MTKTGADYAWFENDFPDGVGTFLWAEDQVLRLCFDANPRAGADALRTGTSAAAAKAYVATVCPRNS